MSNMFAPEYTPEFPVWTRVFTVDGEIIEFASVSTRDAEARVRKYVREEYFGKVLRVEREYLDGWV